MMFQLLQKISQSVNLCLWVNLYLSGYISNGLNYMFILTDLFLFYKLGLVVRLESDVRMVSLPSQLELVLQVGSSLASWDFLEGWVSHLMLYVILILNKYIYTLFLLFIDVKNFVFFIYLKNIYNSILLKIKFVEKKL